jgi:hypothetical protein
MQGTQKDNGTLVQNKKFSSHSYVLFWDLDNNGEAVTIPFRLKMDRYFVYDPVEENRFLVSDSSFGQSL